MLSVVMHALSAFRPIPSYPGELTLRLTLAGSAVSFQPQSRWVPRPDWLARSMDAANGRGRRQPAFDSQVAVSEPADAHVRLEQGLGLEGVQVAQ